MMTGERNGFERKTLSPAWNPRAPVIRGFVQGRGRCALLNEKREVPGLPRARGRGLGGFLDVGFNQEPGKHKGSES